MIMADVGYLMASPTTPATEVVMDPAQATHFVDIDSAIHRARLLTQLGWRDLRVVEFGIPSHPHRS